MLHTNASFCKTTDFQAGKTTRRDVDIIEHLPKIGTYCYNWVQTKCLPLERIVFIKTYNEWL